MDLLERIRRAVGNRYAIDREVGQGGMSVVFLAQDLKHDRRVAVKVLRPELAGSLATDRFLREIRISASLQHPHILQLLDSGQADGLPFCVLPYVEGETLRERLEREQQLDVDEVVRIVQEVSDALDYAHEKEVIHRDIKPSNIFLSGDHTFVGDFGVAKALSVAGGERLTQSGFAIGTPSYMSPEQATGETHLDGRSDVYSLGCMTFEMLAGEPPFSGPTGAAIIAKQASQDAPPLRVVRPRVPWGIEQAVEKALAKVPADRFSTAARFAQALSAGRETQNPPQWIVRVADAIRRRWAFSAALGYAALVALGREALQRLEGFGAVSEPLLADLTVSLFSLIPLVAAVGWALDPGIRRGASAAGGEGPESSGRLHRFVRWRGGPLILSGLVSACLMVILWPDEADGPTPVDGPSSNSIAILYFQTPQGEEDLRFFASLLTEELIGKFSDIQEASGLTVSPKGAVEESRSRDRPGVETARDLGADYMVDGSVIRSGDSVVVKFSLESPETGQILWRGEVNESGSSAWELLLIQKVADDLAEQLRRRVGVEIRERETDLETENRFAFKAFMGANAQFAYAKQLLFRGHSGDLISEFGKAENGYREAIRLDPQWSAPYVRIGEVAGWKVIFFTEMMDPSDLTAAMGAIDDGIELLDLALNNDPDNPRVLAQKGELLFRRGSNTQDPVGARVALTQAIEYLEAAVENNPNMASAWGTLSNIHLERGDYLQAKLRGQRALGKDAFLENATVITGTLAVAHLNLGEEVEALSRCREVQRRTSDYSGYECELEVMAWGEKRPPDPEKAKALADTIFLLGSRERQPSFCPRVLFALAGVYGRAGMMENALAEMEGARGCCPETLVLWQEAAAEVQVGNPSGAIAVLERLLALDPVRGSRDLIRRVFLPLSDEPRFVGLSDHSPG